MKFLGALAVGLLATGTAFGAAIIDSSTLSTLCTDAGANCISVTFNSADQDISAPLFGPLGIVGTNGSTLTSAPFQGGVPFVEGKSKNNVGNGLVETGLSSYIDINVDGATLSAAGFTVDQGINGDGQGLLFEVFFEGGGSQMITSLDNCINPDTSIATCPTFVGFQIDGSDTPVSYIRISSLTDIEGPERFNLYNAQFIVAGDVPDPDPGEVPEPATFGLMGAALLGLGAVRKFRK